MMRDASRPCSCVHTCAVASCRTMLLSIYCGACRATWRPSAIFWIGSMVPRSWRNGVSPCLLYVRCWPKRTEALTSFAVSLTSRAQQTGDHHELQEGEHRAGCSPETCLRICDQFHHAHGHI